MGPMSPPQHVESLVRDKTLDKLQDVLRNVAERLGWHHDQTEVLNLSKHLREVRHTPALNDCGVDNTDTPEREDVTRTRRTSSVSDRSSDTDPSLASPAMSIGPPENLSRQVSTQSQGPFNLSAVDAILIEAVLRPATTVPAVDSEERLSSGDLTTADGDKDKMPLKRASSGILSTDGTVNTAWSSSAVPAAVAPSPPPPTPPPPPLPPPPAPGGGHFEGEDSGAASRGDVTVAQAGAAAELVLHEMDAWEQGGRELSLRNYPRFRETLAYLSSFSGDIRIDSFRKITKQRKTHTMGVESPA